MFILFRHSSDETDKKKELLEMCNFHCSEKEKHLFTRVMQLRVK